MTDTTSSLQHFLGNTTVYHVSDNTVAKNRQNQSQESYLPLKHRRQVSGMDNLVKSLSVSKTVNYTPAFTQPSLRSIPMPPANNKVPNKHHDVAKIDRTENLRQMLESDNLDEPYIERAARPSSIAHMGITSFISNGQHVRESSNKKDTVPAVNQVTVTVPESKTNPVIIKEDNLKIVSDTLNINDNLSNKSHKSRDAVRKLSVSQESIGYQSLDDPVVGITPNSYNDPSIDLPVDDSRTIINQGVSYTYDSDTILALQSSEPDCILFTRDNWNLESKSFLQANNWICGYNIDYSLLANSNANQNFELTIKKLKLTNLIISYNERTQKSKNSTNNKIVTAEVSMLTFDLFLAKVCPHLGIPSIAKVFSNTVRDNGVHEKLILHFANSESNIYFDVFITFLMNLINSPSFENAVSEVKNSITNFNTSSSTPETNLSNSYYHNDPQVETEINLDSSVNNGINDGMSNVVNNEPIDDEFEFTENLQLKSLLARLESSKKTDSSI
jgi:hypothetical protein